MEVEYQNEMDAKEDPHEDFPDLQNSHPADCIVHHRPVSASLWTNLTKVRIISHLKSFITLPGGRKYVLIQLSRSSEIAAKKSTLDSSGL
jgi:hypothetical protein